MSYEDVLRSRSVTLPAFRVTTRASNMRHASCEWCGKSYHQIRSNSLYCSKACKQKAYRRRVDCDVGSIQREKQRQMNIAITKQMTTKILNCACCGRKLEVGVNHTNLMYCSNACKQKAYRQRKRVD